MSTTSKKIERPLSFAIVIFSIVVVGLVGLLFIISPPDITLPFDPHILPKFNAIMNSGVTIMLLLSLYFIKNKNINAHRFCNVTALIFSALFLVSYVIYHSVSESTVFGDISGDGILSEEEKAQVGGLRIAYLILLLTHIPLAAIILPIILFTFMRAFLGQFPQHKKIARFTMPLWLYVSISGVVIYWMISAYY